MGDFLYDRKRSVTKQEVLDRLKYYIALAEKGMELYEHDKKEAMELAKQIRKSLKVEYKNNDLVKTYKWYKQNDYFLTYKRAIHKALVSVTGPLSYEKLFSFMYDVADYMSMCVYKINDFE